MEQSKNTSLHQVQLSLMTEQERKEIFKMAFAFEDFALRYGQYHLNESVPQFNITSNKLGRWKYFDSFHSNLGKRCNNIMAVFLRKREYSNLYYITTVFKSLAFNNAIYPRIAPFFFTLKHVFS